MTTKDIVVSRELAEKMAKAGFPQDDGIFYWCYVPYRVNDKDEAEFKWDVFSFNWAQTKGIRAPTFNEIWKELPKYIDDYAKTFTDTGESPYQYRILYWIEATGAPLFVEIGNTPQEATGKLWLWVKEYE